MHFHSIEWPILRDAEGGGFGGGGNDNNNGGSDGAAGGFADAGAADASFGGSIEASAGGSGIGAGNANGSGGLSAASGGNGSGGIDTSGSFGSPGGPTVDLSQSGGVSNNAMQFSALDAATLGGLAIGGAATIATTGLGYGLAITAGAALMDAGPVSTAVSHAAHDIGILGADPALADAPSIGMFGTEGAAIDAMNHDGGFGDVLQLNGTDSIWDLSVSGNIAIADHIGGHSAYWDNVLGLPT